jgi:amino-acid N-acetyltransferase
MSTVTKPVLRVATPADLPAIETLLKASALPVDGVREALPGFVVADAGADIVGVAGLEVCCDNALLRSVAVAADWRSRGVGRDLVNRVIADAESRGIHGLYLLTTTADRYFPSFGFSTIARADAPDDIRETGEFKYLCAASSTVMKKALAGAA